MQSYSTNIKINTTLNRQTITSKCNPVRKTPTKIRKKLHRCSLDPSTYRKDLLVIFFLQQPSEPEQVWSLKKGSYNWWYRFKNKDHIIVIKPNRPKYVAAPTKSLFLYPVPLLHYRKRINFRGPFYFRRPTYENSNVIFVGLVTDENVTYFRGPGNIFVGRPMKIL